MTWHNPVGACYTLISLKLVMVSKRGIYYISNKVKGVIGHPQSIRMHLIKRDNPKGYYVLSLYK